MGMSDLSTEEREIINEGNVAKENISQSSLKATSIFLIFMVNEDHFNVTKFLCRNTRDCCVFWAVTFMQIYYNKGCMLFSSQKSFHIGIFIISNSPEHFFSVSAS